MIVNIHFGAIPLFDESRQACAKLCGFLFVQLLDGSAEIRISAKDYLVNEGEMIHLPANEPHGLQATTRFKMLLTMIKE